MLKKCIILALGLLPGMLLAANLGEVAQHAMVPAIFLAKFAHAACYVVGSSLVLGSFMKYGHRRTHPGTVRASQPIIMFLFGVAAICLPIVAQLSMATDALTLY